MVRKQIIPWLCLVMFAQAIAFIACQNSTPKPNISEPAIDPIRRELSTDMNFNDNKQSDEQHENRRGVGVAVVHERKGAYGGSDLLRKPKNAKSGASSLREALARITLSVCVVSYLFLLS